MEEKIKELEKFLDYILDKVEPCYKREVESSVKEFLKETAHEVPVQEQLSKGEMICIYRHLKAFVEKEWDRKENVPDACTNCDQYCNTEDRQALNPWIAFYKLSRLANEPYFGREGADK